MSDLKLGKRLRADRFGKIIPEMRSNTMRSSDGQGPRLRLANGAAATATTSGTVRDRSRPELEQILAEARRTLGRLRSDRVMLEQRLAAGGRVDPIREIRGRSALDEAIDRTVAMIRRLEQLLEEMPRRS